MSAAPPLRVRFASRAACLPSPLAAARRLFELFVLLTLVAIVALAALLLASAAAAQSPTYLSAASVRAQPPGYANADVLAVDWDGDGFRDLLTTSISGGTLGALHGLPGGRFEPVILSTIGPPGPMFPVEHAYRAAAADLDGDGQLDVVAADPDSHVITVLLGDGSGAFAVNFSFTPVGQPVDVALADFNADGFLDLVTVEKGLPGPADGIVVRRGDGVGSFGAAFTALTNASLGACAVADFNADSKLDVAGAAAGALPVAFGNGAFGFVGPLLNPAAGADKYALVLADVNADMLLDAVIGDAAGQVLVRFGAAGGNFARPFTYAAVPPLTRAVVDVAVGDVTGDGLLDLVTANSSFSFAFELGPDSVSVLRGAPGGIFAPAVRLATGDNPLAVALADLNKDGFTDIVAAPWGLGNAALLWARGGGQLPLGVEAHVKVPGVAANRSVVTLADLSADGDRDVLAVDYESGELDVLPNDGAGNLGPLTSWFTDSFLTFTVDMGDLNGDAWPDAVVTGLPAPSTYPMRINGMLGTPAGGFGAITIQPLAAIPSFPHVGGGFDSVALGDWNGDGRTDAVVTADLQSQLLLLMGDGTGGFGAPMSKLLPGLMPRAVEAGDMDGDGDLDLVVAGGVGLVQTPPGFVEVLLNDGTGTFTGSSLPGSDRAFHAVALADLDADGALDVLAVRAPTLFAPNDGPDLWVWMGDGAGQLTGGTGYELVAGVYPPSTTDVAVGDLNGDGRLDAAVTASLQDGYIDDRLLVLPGDGQGGFGAPFDFACGSIPNVVALGDLEGDGRLEAIVGTNAQSVCVLRNLGPQPWRDLGDALAGTAGEPLLVGQGHLQPATPMKLSLVHARPSSLTYLFISLADNPTPFKGGVLHPVPVQQTYGFFTNPLGQVLVGTIWPASPPPGLPLVLQAAVADPAAPAGAALSNGIKAVTQ